MQRWDTWGLQVELPEGTGQEGALDFFGVFCGQDWWWERGQRTGAKAPRLGCVWCLEMTPVSLSKVPAPGFRPLAPGHRRVIHVCPEQEHTGRWENRRGSWKARIWPRCWPD